MQSSNRRVKLYGFTQTDHRNNSDQRLYKDEFHFQCIENAVFHSI